MSDYGSRPPSERPGTTFRAPTGRPPSALRTGTASRLASAAVSFSSSNSGQRLGTSLGYAGNMITDRPITQSGLSGLQTRAGTASGMRQVKDKRYWQAILQSKIQEIAVETEKLSKEKKTLDREKSAKKLYEKKVKAAAKELTILQSQLTDMNLALDTFSSGMTRQQLQSETLALRERNESLQGQLESVFRERQAKDEQNKDIEGEIERERNKINEMIFALSPNDQAKYKEYQGRSERLRAENMDIHGQIELCQKQKERLSPMILNSQSRLEALRLHTRLRELVTKRNQLREEEMNRLSPAQEREKLIEEVRSNNQALASIGRQMRLVEEQVNNKRELLQQVEKDLEEGNSDRHTKYLELKKRDEVMTAFLETFEQNMQTEKKNVETLKNQIMYAIEQMTLAGISTSNFGLAQKDMFSEKNDLNSQNGLLKEYKKLCMQLKQLQIMEKRNSKQIAQLKEEESGLLGDIQKFSNLEILRNNAAKTTEEQSSILHELKDKKRVTENVVEEAQQRNKDIRDELRGNEIYRQISHLEDKLNDIIKDKKEVQEIVDRLKQEFVYDEIKNDTMSLVDDYNRTICAEMGLETDQKRP